MGLESIFRLAAPAAFAGPLVMISLTIAQAVTSTPGTLEIDLGVLLIGTVVVPLSSLIGVLPALVAMLVGSGLMLTLCAISPLFRHPILWVAAGLAMTLAACRWSEFSPEWTFAYGASATAMSLSCWWLLVVRPESAKRAIHEF